MEYNIKFKAPVAALSSTQFHALSKNGPYLDAHFGPLTKKTPVGQTYYARPLSNYIPPDSKQDGALLISIKDCIPFVHAQGNEVTQDLEVSGHIKISPFKWEKGVAKIFPNQIIQTKLRVKNFTGLPMQGLHIHDGVNKGLMTAFGPISYFLYTTPTWSRRYNMSKESQEFSKAHSPLPATNTAILDNKTLLEYSNSIPIKKI